MSYPKHVRNKETGEVKLCLTAYDRCSMGPGWSQCPAPGAEAPKPEPKAAPKQEPKPAPAPVAEKPAEQPKEAPAYIKRRKAAKA